MPDDDWLKAQRRLEARLARLERAVLGAEETLAAALAERGLKVHRANPTHRLILPPETAPEAQERFYGLMQRYSFRLFLRDAVRLVRFRPEQLTRFCSPRTANAYLRFLVAARAVEVEPEGGFRLLREVGSLGPSLEWFVARLFEREFLAPSMYGVRFRKVEAGGDYDVIALVEGALVYAEVKASPPKGIELPEVRAFLRRCGDLAPEVALFIVDTELRMKDKMVPLFEEASGGRPVLRLHQELFKLAPATYILNSRQSLRANLRRCLMDARRRML